MENFIIGRPKSPLTRTRIHTTHSVWYVKCINFFDALISLLHSICYENVKITLTLSMYYLSVPIIHCIQCIISMFQYSTAFNALFQCADYSTACSALFECANYSTAFNALFQCANYSTLFSALFQCANYSTAFSVLFQCTYFVCIPQYLLYAQQLNYLFFIPQSPV